jgi:uncharacterized DUF497 family protein
MDVEFDPAKGAENVRLRGLSFSMAEDFDFETAPTAEDTRFDHGERRWISLGLIGSRTFAVAFTWRDGRLRVDQPPEGERERAETG